jgi:hemolysin III
MEKIDIKKLGKQYSVAEEVANALTHGFGALLSVIGLVVLVTLASLYGDTWQIVAVSIYGTTLILLYLTSTLYHSLRGPSFKAWFKRLDHSAIYLLIAGSYTPFVLITMREPLGWGVLIAVWALAIVGIIYKVFFMHRFRIFAITGYVLMGWLCVLLMGRLSVVLSPNALFWLLAGGGAYMLGIPFYVWHKLPYNHAVWHVFVILGSISHFFAVYIVTRNG